MKERNGMGQKLNRETFHINDQCLIMYQTQVNDLSEFKL